MINDIGNKITTDSGKRNWIDQNNVVFGYDDYQQCCEYFGWGVYDPKTGEKVAEDPAGLPYHFDFEAGARENEGRFYTEEDCPDKVQVTIVHDDDPTKTLVFECFNCHNGYYYHNFSFKRLENIKKPKEDNRNLPRYEIPRKEGDPQFLHNFAQDNGGISVSGNEKGEKGMTFEEFRKGINIRDAKCCANCKHYKEEHACYLPQLAEISDKNKWVFESRRGWYIPTDPCDVCDKWEAVVKETET